MQVGKYWHFVVTGLAVDMSKCKHFVLTGVHGGCEQAAA
jgi:hypothetical protein